MSDVTRRSIRTDEDLYVTPIPGGMAYWWRPEEMPRRRSREKQVIETANAGLLQKSVTREMVQAGEVSDVDVYDMLGQFSQLTEDEIRALFSLNEKLAWVYLKGWTLTTSDGIRPLPEDPDAFLDLEPELYDALMGAVARIRATESKREDQFTVAAVEDPASPTGGSDG